MAGTCGNGPPEADFSSGWLRFRSYPFAPASVRREAAWLAPARLLGWNPHGAPPCVYLEGEVLFVSATQSEDLARWADAHGVPRVQVVDVWALLLEPFLDTEFSAEQQQATLNRLAECGFPRTEVERWRARVGSRMLLYNSVVWEWVHLGHYDLLQAVGESVYWESMPVAFRGFRSGR